MPSRTHTSQFEDEDDNILQDGETFRVPLYLRDGAINPKLTPTQRAIAEDALNLHKPGFRYPDQAALDRVEQAYAAYDQADSNRWKTAGDATSTFRGQQEGDQCTINGAPGHLNSKLECIPDPQDHATMDAREMAYAAYDAFHGARWRTR